jgi:hypothetical protein
MVNSKFTPSVYGSSLLVGRKCRNFPRKGCTNPSKFIADSSTFVNDALMHAHPCAGEKGKPVVRRGTEPGAPYLAGLPNRAAELCCSALERGGADALQYYRHLSLYSSEVPSSPPTRLLHGMGNPL